MTARAIRTSSRRDYRVGEVLHYEPSQLVLEELGAMGLDAERREVATSRGTTAVCWQVVVSAAVRKRERAADAAIGDWRGDGQHGDRDRCACCGELLTIEAASGLLECRSDACERGPLDPNEEYESDRKGKR